MVSQPKIFHAFGVALGLFNVLGVQGHWLGPMAEPGDLAKRAVPTCSVGFVACGNSGCVDETLCCNQDAGWNCVEGNACYTVSGTVDCYSATNIMPTTARACYDYAMTGCSGAGCFQCVYTTAPYCYTQVLYGATQIWIDCTSSPATYTVGSHAATTIGASGVSVTPRPGVSSSSSSSSSLTSVPFSTITPAPIVTPTNSNTPSSSSSSSSGLSGGAIAGIAIGAFAVIAIIGVLAFFLWKKSRNTPAQPQHLPPQMEPAQYQPPQPPYTPGLPQYQPVAGQTIGSPVSYVEPPKGSFYPPQTQPQHPHQQGFGPAELQAPGPAELS